MKASLITAIAVLGFAASPALAATASSVTSARATAHRTVEQVCQSQRAMAKAKKESWKVANQNCNAAKQQAKLTVRKAKMERSEAHNAAKAPKKG